MAGSVQFSLEKPTLALVEVLSAKSAEIPWAEDITYICKRIGDIYDVFGPLRDIPKPALYLASKIKETEKYVSIDLERHITLHNSQSPFYVVRLAGQLDKILGDVQNCVAQNGGSFTDSLEALRGLSHVAAELQALANEYGFCKTLDAILEVAEASKKLDALVNSLSRVDGNVPPDVVRCLHDASSISNGIRQALTDYHYKSLQSKFDSIANKLTRLEHDFTSQFMKVDSTIIMEYLAQQHLLRQPFVDSIIASDTFDVINSHMIHPGTRGWIMDSFARFCGNPDKRIFYVAGKHGTGKSAIAASICKLYNYDVVANHFFDGSQGSDVLKNQMNGMIQSIASDMCRTIPEYVNYLDDNYNNNDLTKETGSWKQAYEALIRKPVQDLYGVGKNVNKTLKAKVIVIDGLDEMNQSEWEEFKTFQQLFTTQLAPAFRLFYTTRVKFLNNFFVPGDHVDGIRLEDRSTANKHIKDVEIYLSTCLGAILSGEDEVDTPMHAKSDEMTLQNTVDELLKCSAGRFDYAIQLMESFAAAFSSSGQFLSSVKRATQPVRQSIGNEYDQKMSDFASPYRAYRDKEGRSVTVRVMRQSQYLMDKTRVALIRGRQQHLNQ